MSDRAIEKLLHEHGRRLAEGPWDALRDCVGVPTAGRMGAHATPDVLFRRKGSGREMVRKEGPKPEADTVF